MSDPIYDMYPPEPPIDSGWWDQIEAQDASEEAEGGD